MPGPGTYVRTDEIREKLRLAAIERYSGESGQSLKDKIGKAQIGRPHPMKGKKHSEQSKSNMSFGHIGIRLTKEERRKRRVEENKKWLEANPDKAEVYKEARAITVSEKRKTLRHQAIQKLGGRCSSLFCRCVNDDGTKGCTDFRLLQFDHVLGKGRQERKMLTSLAILKKILLDNSEMYQLLCANCNWIKAIEKGEFVFRNSKKESS